MLGLSSVPQTLVSWLLHKVAGKYIEDIDSRIKDVSFGPFGGKFVSISCHGSCIPAEYMTMCHWCALMILEPINTVFNKKIHKQELKNLFV